jgi:multisubunit Na+/H+ antiporter MnhG subunit
MTTVTEETNGAAMAAILGAGIGGFAVGFFVILSELGIFSAPTLYAPAGGLSGRTTFAVVAWLIGWGILHSRWKNREIAEGAVFTGTLALIALGVLLTFPPFWGVFG